MEFEAKAREIVRRAVEEIIQEWKAEKRVIEAGAILREAMAEQRERMARKAQGGESK